MFFMQLLVNSFLITILQIFCIVIKYDLRIWINLVLDGKVQVDNIVPRGPI